MQNQAYTLQVSTEGVLKSLGDQFTSSSTFIKELAQNARRAGATRIDISYDEKTGVIRFDDDGNGIDSPQPLLNIGKSGWSDLDLIDRENPFGIGFASAIFAASHIDIETIGWAMSVNTERLLNLEPVVAQNSAMTRGTCISLKLLDSVRSSLEQTKALSPEAMERNFRGFAIPIFFNGEEVTRSHHFDESFKPFPLGHYQSPMSTVLPALAMRVYLQGQCVHDSESVFGSDTDQPNFIVHLDPRRFRARVPDRDKLIDEDVILPDIRQHLTELWMQELEKQKHALSPDAFTEKYWNIICHFNASQLVNDLPLPPWACAVYNTPQRCGRWFGAYRENLSPLTSPLPIGSPRIDYFCYEGEETSALSLYAFLLGLPQVQASLPTGHWAKTDAIDLDEMNYSVTANTPRQEVRFIINGGRFAKIIICDSFTLAADAEDKAQFPDFVVDDHPVYSASESAFYLPVKIADSRDGIESLLLLTGDYEEEINVDVESLDEDIRELRDVIRLALGGKPADAIKAVLSNASSSLLQELAGKRFSLSISTDGEITVSEE